MNQKKELFSGYLNVLQLEYIRKEAEKRNRSQAYIARELIQIGITQKTKAN